MDEIYEVLILNSWTIVAKGEKQPNSWLSYELKSGVVGFATPDKWRVVTVVNRKQKPKTKAVQA